MEEINFVDNSIEKRQKHKLISINACLNSSELGETFLFNETIILLLCMKILFFFYLLHEFFTPKKFKTRTQKQFKNKNS